MTTKCDKCGEEYPDNLDGLMCSDVDCDGRITRAKGVDRKDTTLSVSKDVAKRLRALLGYGESPNYFIMRCVEKEEMRRMTIQHKTRDKH